MPQQKPKEIPLGEDFIPLGQDFEPVQQEPGMLASLWQKANEPITTIPGDVIKSIPDAGFSGYDRIRDIVGDIASGLTSPLNVGLAVASGGSSLAANAGRGGLAQVLNYVTKGLSAPVAAEGAIDTFSPDSSLGERGLGLLEMVGGIAGVKSKVLKGKVPPTPEEVLTKPKRSLKLNSDGTFTDKSTGEIIGKDGKTVISSADPNLNQGMGDPELAGSTPYKAADDIPLGQDFVPITGKDVDLPLQETALNRSRPEKSDYVPRVLNEAGDGVPGLSVEDYKSKIPALSDSQRIVYRDPNGKPIAVAKLIQDSNGQLMVEDFAADKTKGLLYGKAVKSVGQQIREMGADIPAGTVTPDAINLIKKAKNVTAPTVVRPSFGGSKRNPSLPKTEKVPDDIMLEVQATVPDATPGEVSQHIGYVTDKKNPSKITEAINFSRALKTSIDLSAPLRQGLPLALRKEFYTSLWPMVRSLGSENFFRLSQDEIASRALFKPTLTTTGGKVGKSFAEESGLFLSDLTDLSRREEAIASTWAEKIPGVRASNRAYTTFLNRLRADTFENLVNQTGATNNIPLAKNLASYINNATGRGSLGQLESIAPVLNAALFSPRFISSRLQMFRPDKFISSPTPIKKEIIKSFISTIGSGMALGELARAGGAKVSNDPTSSDFRKIQIGGTVRIDPFAGYQQYAVATSRILEAAHKHYIQEKKLNPFEKPDAIAQRFLRSKASPVVSTAWDTITGTDYLGNRVNLPGELKDLFAPMFLETAYELFEEDPELLPWAVPAGLGMGVNVGGPKK